jgi:cobalt-zinc-cadmium resistance protein CzcA
MMLAGAELPHRGHSVHDRMEELRRTLPAGVHIDEVYDRAQFIDRTLSTVGNNLLEGALLVSWCCWSFSARCAAACWSRSASPSR